MKKICMLLLIMFVNFTFGFGQTSKTNSNGFVFYSLKKKKYKNGDTLFIRVKNTSNVDRIFSVEAASLDKNDYYSGAVFSAYLNKDTSFFKFLAEGRKASKRNNIYYTLPKYTLNFHDVKSGEEKVVAFAVKGHSVKKAIFLEIIIQTDLVDGKSLTLYSKPIKLYAIPE